jgi:hypothetical protein
MVDWSKISHYSFLDEFELLRDSRQDVRDKPWAKPAIRECMKKALRIKRAQEELKNCNMEIHCLHTSIVDEDQFFELTLQNLHSQQDPIYGAVKEYVTYR